MDKSMQHALEWDKALNARMTMDVDSPERQVLDTVIAYERMRGWISVAHEAIEMGAPFEIIVSVFVQQGFDVELASGFTEKLLALAYAESQGVEITVNIFNQVMDLAN